MLFYTLLFVHKTIDYNVKNEKMSTSRDTINREQVTINSLLELLRQIDLEVIEVMEVTKNFNWNRYKDSRELLKVNIHENVLTTTFTLSMLAETMNTYSQRQWWSKILPYYENKFEHNSNFDFEKFVSDRQTRILNREKDSLLLDCFYEFETSIRNIVRVLGNIPNKDSPNKYLKGIEKLYLIRKSFIEDYLKIDLEDLTLIELLQDVRNSIHNSGIFFSFNQQDKEVLYKDITYRFSNGCPVNFVDWEFTKFVIIDLIKVIKKILTHDLITGVNEVIDPVTKITWEK